MQIYNNQEYFGRLKKQRFKKRNITKDWNIEIDKDYN